MPKISKIRSVYCTVRKHFGFFHGFFSHSKITEKTETTKLNLAINTYSDVESVAWEKLLSHLDLTPDKDLKEYIECLKKSEVETAEAEV